MPNIEFVRASSKFNDVYFLVKTTSKPYFLRMKKGTTLAAAKAFACMKSGDDNVISVEERTAVSITEL